MCGQDCAIKLRQIDATRRLFSEKFIVQRHVLIHQSLGDGAIGEARIQVMKTISLRNPAGERSLAGSRRTVDGDRKVRLRCWQILFVLVEQPLSEREEEIRRSQTRG